MNILLYSDTVVFNILLLFIILFKNYKAIIHDQQWPIFQKILVCTLVSFCLNLLCAFFTIPGVSNIKTSYSFSFIIISAYLIVQNIVSYLWYAYSEKKQNPMQFDDVKQIASMIPIFVNVVLILISYRFKLIFYLDENFNFQRGVFFHLELVIIYGYMLYAAIKAFAKSKIKSNRIEKFKYEKLAFFALFPLIFGIIEMFNPNIPALCCGLTTTIILVYIECQEQLVSIDPLTGLNNRNQLSKVLNNLKVVDNKLTYLLVLDIDKFKRINDIYGHIEGDNTLINIANVLKDYADKEHFFLCRYGGDEFIIKFDCDTEEDVINLCNNLKYAVKHIDNKKYSVSISIGYSKYTNDYENISQFIEEADKKLYKDKKINND